MRFNYNNYMLEENRVIDVINDINTTYPDIPKNIVRIIASLEKPIVDYDYNPLVEFTRLYNMLFVLDGDESLIDTYNIIIKRIREVYTNIINIKINSSDMFLINNIMGELIKYFNGKRSVFPTINEFKKI